MVKIKVRAGKEAVQQAEAGDFGDPPPPALYHLRLEAIEKKTTKGTDDRYYLNCRWRPVAKGREGEKLEKRLGTVWDTVSLTSDDAEWSRARLALALGAKPNRAGNVDLDIELDSSKPGSPVGTVCLGRVTADTYNGEYKPNLGWIGPLEAGAEGSEAFEDEEGEEEEAAEAFEDEEELENSEFLTQEQLEGMTNKELGAVAKDFDIETKQFVKKVKGKVQADRNGLIEAVLEAQGNFSPEEEDDEDDPF